MYDFVFEGPCKVVGNKYSIKSGGESGIDVGAGGVADHPCLSELAAVALG